MLRLGAAAGSLPAAASPFPRLDFVHLRGAHGVERSATDLEMGRSLARRLPQRALEVSWIASSVAPARWRWRPDGPVDLRPPSIILPHFDNASVRPVERGGDGRVPARLTPASHTPSGVLGTWIPAAGGAGQPPHQAHFPRPPPRALAVERLAFPAGPAPGATDAASNYQRSALLVLGRGRRPLFRCGSSPATQERNRYGYAAQALTGQVVVVLVLAQSVALLSWPPCLRSASSRPPAAPKLGVAASRPSRNCTVRAGWRRA